MSYKFSILMANYNNSAYIAEAIESIINQTYCDWEIVIVDDASTDDSVLIIKKYLNDRRIKLILHKKNLGCGATKRECAKNASGQFMGILDPDDSLEVTAIEKIVNVYKNNPNVGFVYSTYYECDDNLSIIRKNSWSGKMEADATNIFDSKVGHFMTFEKEAYQKTPGFDQSFMKAIDKDIIYKLEEVAEFYFIDEALYKYRMHKSGIAALGRNARKARLWNILAQYRAYKRRISKDISNFSRKEMADILYEGSVRSLLLFNLKFFSYFIIKAIGINPNIFRIVYIIKSKV